MTATSIAFWIVATLSVVSGFGVILHKSPLRSALFLVINMVCLAVLYLLQNAQVLALLQILVYAGAIMVLFIFVIMLLNLGGELATSDPLGGQRLVGALLGLALLAGVGWGINQATPAAATTAEAERVFKLQTQGLNQVQIIGWDLFTRYVYPFELTSFLLLVGAIGVILLTKRRSLAVTAANADGSP